MKQILKTMALSGIAIFIAILLVIYPKDAFEASVRGLSMWWEVVFPSLLPFFITAELLLSFGVVKFLGVLLEPIMRPLFNVPGVGSFAWIMGMASGYPTGAKISVRLREEKQLTKTEAERLISFTNASSPLFIFGAISVGFFHDAKLGILIATCHYLGNAFVGICMRFYGRSKEKYRLHSEKRSHFSLIHAFMEMHKTRIKDPRPLGEILGDAVIHSIKTLVMVGGFIILFSVLTRLFYLVQLTSNLAKGLAYIFSIIHYPIELSLPLISGLFEITVGANLISQVKVDSFLANIIAISFILGFNGFSIQAQVASILANSDIRFAPYFFARILHGLFASFLTILLYQPLYKNRQVYGYDNIPVMYPLSGSNWLHVMEIIKQIGPVISFTFICLSIVILIHRMANDGK